MLIKESTVVLDTPTGPMQCGVWRPAGDDGRRYPGVILYSEIFQLTGPIRRACAFLAGHGFVVVAPEVYHELEPLGAVLPYTADGTARGNAHKIAKPVAAYDSDAAACVEYLRRDGGCTGRVGAMGMCLGGALAFRAALHPGVAAAACFYPTDLHKRSLGKGEADDSVARAGSIAGELLMVFGRQDPHIPQEGRLVLYHALVDQRRTFSWHEFNGQHAFLRDESSSGRYDPQLARLSWALVLDLFGRTLGGGGLPATASKL